MSRPMTVNLLDGRFGRLVVVSRAPNRNNKVYWHCRCDCGNEKDVQTFDLLYGKTVSCGCYHRERQREIMKLRYDYQRNSIFISGLR